MFETIWKGLTGRWGILALILVATPTGRKVAKIATKEIVRATIVAGEKVKELTAELREEGSELMAELREEQANGDSQKKGRSIKRIESSDA